MKAHIIYILKQASGFVSGEDLSLDLGMTRAAVWKHIEELRHVGYGIEAVPHQGYRLSVTPDRLSGLELEQGLNTKAFGQQVHYFDSLPSTMDEAFRLGMEGAPEGTIVVAETQTKGRGRMGRTWSSPKGKGIYFSMVLRPPCSPKDAARLTLLAAVAVGRAVEMASGVRALIKWPNDLLVQGQKLCGILTEMNAELDRVRFVVLGIGINVNTPASRLLPEATSLRVEAKKSVDRVVLCQEVLRQLEASYEQAMAEGYARVFEEWRTRSATIGRKVKFVERGEELEGTVTDIDEDGGLLVRLKDGRTVKKVAGDIVL